MFYSQFGSGTEEKQTRTERVHNSDCASLHHVRSKAKGKAKCKGSPFNRPLRPRGWVEVQPYPFMTSVLDWVVGGQHHASAALPHGKTRCPLYRRLGGPQGRSGRVRKISPPPGFHHRTVQHVASRYTDWAIAAFAAPQRAHKISLVRPQMPIKTR